MTKSLTGGARIGWFNASYPFASLTVTPDSLTLKIFIFTVCTFKPSQVVSITQYTVVPLIGRGIRIEHTVARYPRRIIFWCFAAPESVLAQIAFAGFIPSPSGPNNPVQMR